MRATKIIFTCKIRGALPPNFRSPLFDIAHTPETTIISVKHEIIGESFRIVMGIINNLPDQICTHFNPLQVEIENLQFVQVFTIQPDHFDLPKIEIDHHQVKIDKNHDQSKLVNLLLGEYQSGDIELAELVDCVISLDALGSENLTFLPGISTKRLAILQQHGIYSLPDFEKIGSERGIQNIPRPTLENALAAFKRYKEVIQIDTEPFPPASTGSQTGEDYVVFNNRIAHLLQQVITEYGGGIEMPTLLFASTNCDIIAAYPNGKEPLEFMGLASIGVGIWAVTRELHEKMNTGDLEFTWVQFQRKNFGYF